MNIKIIRGLPYCAVLFFSLSCTEEAAPVAGFDIVNQQSSSVFLTFHNLTIVNKSLNAVSYEWDFGNGATSTEIEPTFSFEESGDYFIKLTVTGIDGSVTSTIKGIRVLDRVVKRLSLTSIHLNLIGVSDTEIYLLIKQFRTLANEQVDNMVYISEVVSLSASELPYAFIPTERTVINPSLLNSNCLAFEIHAISEGQDYILGSNLHSGASLGSVSIQGSDLSFATSSLGGAFTIECDYN